MYVSSSSTVVVQASLTTAGRRLLAGVNPPSIWGSPNITKFSLGDSDINYSAVTATGGLCLPKTGFVIGAGKHNPEIKCMVLKSGIIDTSSGGVTVPPGEPVIITSGPNVSFHVDSQRIIVIQLSTEWPRGMVFQETYTYTREYNSSSWVDGRDIWDSFFVETFVDSKSLNISIVPGAKPLIGTSRWYSFRGKNSNAQTVVTVTTVNNKP